MTSPPKSMKDDLILPPMLAEILENVRRELVHFSADDDAPEYLRAMMKIGVARTALKRAIEHCRDKAGEIEEPYTAWGARCALALQALDKEMRRLEKGHKDDKGASLAQLNKILTDLTGQSREAAIEYVEMWIRWNPIRDREQKEADLRTLCDERGGSFDFMRERIASIARQWISAIAGIPYADVDLDALRSAAADERYATGRNKASRGVAVTMIEIAGRRS